MISEKNPPLYDVMESSEEERMWCLKSRIVVPVKEEVNRSRFHDCADVTCEGRKGLLRGRRMT